METKRRVLGLVVLGGLAVVLALTAGCKRTPQERRDQYLKAGDRYFAKKDYQRAALEFRNAAREAPSDAEARYKLALAFLELGDYRTAIGQLMKATELNPKHVAAQGKLAQLMVTSQDQEVLKQAQDRLTTALEVAPGDADLLNTLALTDLRLNKPEEAEKILQQALEKSPGHLRSAMALAAIRLTQKDFAGAEKVLKDAMGQAPKSVDPHLALSRFYVATGKLPEAERELNAALQIDPKSGAALLGLAALRLRAGKASEAEAIYKKVSALPGQEFKAAYALYLLSSKQTDRGIQELERLNRENPRDRDVRDRLVVTYLLANRAGQAEQVLNAALQKNSKDFQALLQRGALYARTGRIPQAEADLRKAQQIQPESPEVHYHLAVVRRSRGETLTERQELTEALKLGPGLLAARLDLASSFLASNSAKDALRVLDEAPATQRQDVRLVVARNWALLGTGDLAEARRSVDEGLRAARIPDLLLQDAQLKFLRKDVAGGRKSLEEALSSSPEDLRALQLLVSSYVAEKQGPKGLEVMRQHAAKHPNSARVQYLLGTALAGAGNTSEARDALAAAKKAGGDAFKAPDLLLAQLDIREGKTDSARKVLTALLGAPASAGLDARLLLGGLEVTAGNYPAAIDHYRKVLEAQPRNALALNNLAYLLVERANDLDEGLKYAQQAKELAPQDPAVDDTIGWAFYRKGLYSTAIPHLERAAGGTGATARRKYHLAMAYLKNGDMTQGLKTLEAAQKMDPKLPEAAAAGELLASMANRR